MKHTKRLSEKYPTKNPRTILGEQCATLPHQRTVRGRFTVKAEDGLDKEPFPHRPEGRRDCKLRRGRGLIFNPRKMSDAGTGVHAPPRRYSLAVRAHPESSSA